MLNPKEAYEKTKQRIIKIDEKDTKYVIKYINKQIKQACKRGKTHLTIYNQIWVNKIHCCFIDKLPKVTDVLYAKGYQIERFQVFAKDKKIKISWENH